MSAYERCSTCGGDADVNNVTCEACDRKTAERIAELEAELRAVNAPYNSPGPADRYITERAAVADEYIADGEPAQKVNWLYWKLLEARRQLAAAKIASRHSRRPVETVPTDYQSKSQVTEN